MQNKFIVMSYNDNCATALEEILEDNELTVKGKKIRITQKIPYGHKFALINIKKGEFILKYGEIIGVATTDIKSGDWVHVHNVRSHYLKEMAE